MKAKLNAGTSHEKSIKHTRLGVWDLYEEVSTSSQFVVWPTLQPLFDIIENIPYVWRMILDIIAIQACKILLVAYSIVEFALSLIPAISLWYSGQLLSIALFDGFEAQVAVEHRAIDKNALFRIAAGRFLCVIATRALRYLRRLLSDPLNTRIKQHYSIHIFRASARLDVPTFDDPQVQQQLETCAHSASRSSIAWDTLSRIFRVISNGVQLVSQFSVLTAVLKDQRDGHLLALLCFFNALFQWNTSSNPLFRRVWAATVRDPDYIRNEGLKRVVAFPEHRKEITAGGMWPYLLEQYKQGVDRIQDRAGDFWESVSRYYPGAHPNLASWLQDPLKELPQIVFTLRAIQYPTSIPVSLASLAMITQTTQSFLTVLVSFFEEVVAIAEIVTSVHKLYEITKIKNQVVNGREAFPENMTDLRSGVNIEFRNVSFKYPGCDEWALRRVSFKISKGQLCVIVGANGSGKSTILKLITRLYDPTEGEILVDGRDIRSLRLDDLRKTISVLFQDYTYFPLPIADNIGLGAPIFPHATNPDYIEEAAQLGGASDFIDKLPEQYATYLERPVRNQYSALVEGAESAVREVVENDSGGHVRGLSGGQMQRIALSRTFMRSVVADRENDVAGIGLLLFDEPSASLDPTAEHDLFNRLRRLRGNKTMVFSSHRFGNLTKHADMILFMNDSVIVEEGTHDALMNLNGEYQRLWMLQAQAFL